jgi:NitT/TauT family transport system permease protein
MPDGSQKLLLPERQSLSGPLSGLQQTAEEPQKEPILKNWFLKSIAIIVFIALWEIGPRAGFIDPQFVSTPSTIVKTMWIMTQSGDLILNTLVSLQRALIAFAIAVAVAVPLGFLLGGWFTTLEKILNPLLQVLGQVNPFTIFPVIVLFFGIGEIAKVIIIFWVAVWPILFNTVAGAKNVDATLVKCARAMGASKPVLFYKVILPAAAPYIFTGLRMSTGISFFMLIGAEMIGASRGLGWLVLNSQTNYQIPRLYAGVVTIALLGLLISNLVIRLEKRVIVWREQITA